MRITCYDSNGGVLERLYQWDQNQTLTVRGIDTRPLPIFHFCNLGSKLALVVSPTVTDNGLTVKIPNILLQQADPIIVYIYCETKDDGYRTEYAISIPIIPRPKPVDYMFEDDVEYVSILKVMREIGELSDLTTTSKDTLVAAINEAAASGGAGSMELRVSGGYIQYSTDGGRTWANLIAVADLKGDKGDPGAPGKNGHSPVVMATKSGKTTTINVDGAAIATIEDGADGAPGSDATVTAASITGALGYKPVAPGDIPVVPTAEINANTAARHTHANKAVIDSITAAKTAAWDAKAGTAAATQSAAGLMSAADKAKLDGIERGANKTTVPSALKNPNALTIKIGGTTVTYDGSAAKTVTIADGSEVAY